MKKQINASGQIKYILSVITPPLIAGLTQSIGDRKAHKRLQRCARQLYRNHYAKPADTLPEAYSVMPAEELFVQQCFYQLQALL